MATIIQTPDSLSLLRNLKHYIIESASEVTFVLSKGGTAVLSETYYPDANDRIDIDVSDVIAQYLSTAIPTSNAFAQTSAAATFTATVAGSSAGSFTVVNGGVRKLSETASAFLTANWLTWQPQVKQVTWNSPEYLSYYFQAAGTIKARFYKKTGTTQTIILRSQSATGVLLTINTTFSRLVALADLEADDIYGLVDIWVADGSTQISYIQRYVCTETLGDEHYYLAVNSLGGIDTFTFHGACMLAPEIDHESALNDDVKLNITSDAERKWEQNTGYAGLNITKWWFELLASTKQWAVMNGDAEPIVIDTSSLQMKDRDNLHSCTFAFSLCEEGRLQNISRTSGTLPSIEVPSPSGSLFFLELRLADYPDASLSDSILFLVQSPFTQEWSKTSLGALKQWLLSVVINSSVGQAAHTHSNKAVIDLFGESDGTPTYNGQPLVTSSSSSVITNGLSERISELESLIEKVNIGTVAEPVYAVHVKSEMGFYSDSFISAGGIGSSSSGGGGGLIDSLHRYADLGGTFDDSANDVFNAYTVNAIHLRVLALEQAPAGGVTSVAGLTGEVSASALQTALGIDILGTLAQSLQAQVDSVASRDNYDELTATALYADTAAISSLHAGSIALNGVNLFDSSNKLNFSVLPALYWANVQVSNASNSATSPTVASLTSTGQVSAGSFKLASGTPTITWDATNSAWHLNGNFYADGWIAAGGVGSGSGSGSGIDIDRLWQSLTNNPADAGYANTKIAAAHIPDMASTYGYLTTTVAASTYQPIISDLSSIRSNATNGNTAYSWGNHADAGYASASALAADEDTISKALQSLQSQIDSVAAKDCFDELTSSTFFADIAAVSSLYVENITLNGSDINATFASKLTYAANALNLVAKNDAILTTITGANIVTILDTNPVNRATGDKNGNDIFTYYVSGVGLDAQGYPDNLLVTKAGSITALTIPYATVSQNTRFTYTADGTQHSNAEFPVDWFIPESDGNNGYRLRLNPKYGGLYADGWLTAGGIGSSDSDSTGLLSVWASLIGNSDDYARWGINPGHLPTIVISGNGISGTGSYSYNSTSRVATETLSLSLTTTGVTAGIYKSVTVDAYGRVTAGSNPTTIAGYGITDAYTKTEVDTLISNLDIPVVSECLQSLQSQIDSVATRNNYDELTATVLFADTVSASNIYGALSGNATTASYLVSASYSIGGAKNPVYFSGGLPVALTATEGSTSVPVYLNAGTITAVTPSLMFPAFTSNGSTNLSITIAGQNHTATLYATYDSASENISDKFGIVSNTLQSLQSQIDAVASRDAFDELTATTVSADMVAAETFYGELVGNAATASRLIGATAYSVWGVEYWANGVPKAVTGRPALYIGTTQVQTSAASQDLAGIGTISASGLATIAGGVLVTTTPKYYFGATDKYIELVNIGTNANPVYALHSNIGFYSDEFVTAGGVGSSSTGGIVDSIHRYADLGGTFSDSDNDVFNAYTVNKINADLSARIASLEGGSAMSITITGTGNVVSDISKSGTTITVTKGITALTSHQSVSLASGTNNGTLKLTTAAGTTDNIAVTGLGSLAYKSSLIVADIPSLTTAKISDIETWISGKGYVTSSGVTSIGVSVPTGFSVSNSPVTSSGTIAISFASGYSLPTTAKQNNWDAAYGWGNHANAGYLTSANGTTISEALQSLQSQIDSVASRSVYDELSVAVLSSELAAVSDLYVSSIYIGSKTLTATSTIATINGAAIALGGSFSTASITAGTAGTSSSTSGLQSMSVPYVTVNQYGIVTGYGTHTHTLVGSSAIGGTKKPIYYNGSSFTALSATEGSASLPVYLNAGTITACTASSLFSGLSSGASPNLSVTVAGQTRTATLYATYDSASENISDKFGIVSSALQSLQSQVDSVAANRAFDELTVTAFFTDMLSVGSNVNIGGTVYSIGGILSDSYITAGAAASSSDQRLKDDIDDVCSDRALSVLMQLKPKEWTWNDNNAYLYGKRGAGLIAQDVLDVLPFAVVSDAGEYLSLNYNTLHAYEIAGLQNHETRIAALEAENKELKAKLKEYESR